MCKICHLRLEFTHQYRQMKIPKIYSIYCFYKEKLHQSKHTINNYSKLDLHQRFCTNVVLYASDLPSSKREDCISFMSVTKTMDNLLALRRY